MLYSVPASGVLSSRCLSSTRSRLLKALTLTIACTFCLLNLSFLWEVHDSRSSATEYPLPLEEIPTLAKETSYPFTFSACLLFKDDNRILPEWLAYHYTVMPLRQLIIAIDPLSLTSPKPIIEKFVRELPGMNITIWEDADFRQNNKPPKHGKTATPQDTAERVHQAHQYRQKLFYQQCLLELQRRSLNWTMFVDTDEYILFNNYHQNEGIDASSKYRKVYKQMLLGKHLRANLPSVGNLTIAEYIADNQATMNESLWTEYPCINMPRIYFSSKESTTEEVASQVPRGFDPLTFHTLRFRYHQHPIKSRLSAGKSLVDASRYDGRWPKSVHNVMSDDCYNGPFPNSLESPLRVHHYIGPLEFFLRRGQSQRGEENYQKRSNFVSGNDTNDDLRGWLKQFVNIVGSDEALDLTERLKEWAITNYANTLKEIELGSFIYPFYKNISSNTV
jgi:hypothetical protein